MRSDDKEQAFRYLLFFYLYLHTGLMGLGPWVVGGLGYRPDSCENIL